MLHVFEKCMLLTSSFRLPAHVECGVCVHAVVAWTRLCLGIKWGTVMVMCASIGCLSPGKWTVMCNTRALSI